MGLLREEVQIETLRNKVYGNELAGVYAGISVAAAMSYCKTEKISFVRGLVLWRRSDRSEDYHPSRYSRGLVPHR